MKSRERERKKVFAIQIFSQGPWYSVGFERRITISDKNWILAFDINSLCLVWHSWKNDKKSTPFEDFWWSVHYRCISYCSLAIDFEILKFLWLPSPFPLKSSNSHFAYLLKMVIISESTRPFWSCKMNVFKRLWQNLIVVQCLQLVATNLQAFKVWISSNLCKNGQFLDLKLWSRKKRVISFNL